MTTSGHTIEDTPPEDDVIPEDHVDTERHMRMNEIDWALRLMSRFLDGRSKRQWSAFVNSLKKEMRLKSLDPATLDRLVFMFTLHLHVSKSNLINNL